MVGAMTDQALSARIILITGATSGMGRVMAGALAAAGATVAGVDVDSSGLDQLAREPVFCDKLRKIVADVSKAERCRQAVADVQSMFGSLDVLINCAGISMAHAAPQPKARVKFFETDPTGWQRIIATNFIGAFLMARFAVPAWLHAAGDVSSM
jgi:NAD(P)-dependent dehydrogenase (short-subunit alcohol dehydrogenase family)